MNYGLWGMPGVPHKGWQCIGIEDLGAPDAICGMCEKMEIRYSHAMTHPDWPFDPLEVGCVCAGHMEGDYMAARGREKGLMRAMRFAQSKQWKRNATGNLWRKAKGGLVLFVDAAPERQAWRLRGLKGYGNEIHRSLWSSETRARRMAFEVVLKFS